MFFFCSFLSRSESGWKMLLKLKYIRLKMENLLGKSPEELCVTPALTTFISHFRAVSGLLNLTKECECIFSPVQPWTAQNPEGTWEWRSAGWRERDTSDVWQEAMDCGVINGGACQDASVHLILWSKNTGAPHHVHEIDIIPASNSSQWNTDMLRQNVTRIKTCEDEGGIYLHYFLKCKNKNLGCFLC